MKQPQLFKKPKQEVSEKPEICCPYFDEKHKACSHPKCIRTLGNECQYCNKKIK